MEEPNSTLSTQDTPSYWNVELTASAQQALEYWHSQDDYAWLEGKLILEIFDHKGFFSCHLEDSFRSARRLLMNAALLFADKDTENYLQNIEDRGLDAPAQFLKQYYKLRKGKYFELLRFYMGRYPECRYPVGKHLSYHRDFANGTVKKAVITEMHKVRTLEALKRWERGDAHAIGARGIIQRYLSGDEYFTAKDFLDVDRTRSSAPTDVSWILDLFLLDATGSCSEPCPDDIGQLRLYMSSSMSATIQILVVMKALKDWDIYEAALIASRENPERLLPFKTNLMSKLVGIKCRSETETVIEEVIRSEFQAFRSEMMSGIQAAKSWFTSEIQAIRSEIQEAKSISRSLEGKIGGFQRSLDHWTMTQNTKLRASNENTTHSLTAETGPNTLLPGASLRPDPASSRPVASSSGTSMWSPPQRSIPKKRRTRNAILDAIRQASGGDSKPPRKKVHFEPNA